MTLESLLVKYLEPQKAQNFNFTDPITKQYEDTNI